MKPILFNTEMVKAILNGRKTQTRRVVGYKLLNEIYKNDCYIDDGQIFESCMCQGMPDGSGGLEVDRWEEDVTTTYSKYKVGDTLWVREPAKVTEINDYQDCFSFKYLADDKEDELPYLDKWLNDNGMDVPKWVENCQGVPNGCIKEMARIFLKATKVRVERLQDISVRDIEKETGWKREQYSYSNKNRAFYKDYRDLWNSTAKDGYKWENNPYVFVYEFKRVYDV